MLKIDTKEGMVTAEVGGIHEEGCERLGEDGRWRGVAMDRALRNEYANSDCL